MADTTNNERTGTTRSLGMDRWVQFAFVGLFLFSFWFLDHLFADVGVFVAEQANIADPNPLYLTLAAGVISVLIAIGMYRNEKVNRFSKEVAFELEHVTWPSREETWSNTVIVMIVSAISAVILGIFDYVWAAVTGLIY